MSDIKSFIKQICEGNVRALLPLYDYLQDNNDPRFRRFYYSYGRFINRLKRYKYILSNAITHVDSLTYQRRINQLWNSFKNELIDIFWTELTKVNETIHLIESTVSKETLMKKY